jgi:multicomponent K+:H+ antiporter subunit F/multicomponent Na+:H+ antiporter subunit F
MAIDFVNASLAVLVVVIALKTGRNSLLDIALLFSILGFVGTIALARYALGGKVI